MEAELPGRLGLPEPGALGRPGMAGPAVEAEAVRRDRAEPEGAAQEEGQRHEEAGARVRAPLGAGRKQGARALQVEEGSAAQQAAALLPDSTVVGAFHNVSAVLLEDPSVERIDTDVLVLGDDREATDLVQALAGCIPGMRGVYGGRLRNAHQVEALTANLISVNRRYKAHAGLRVTDV